MIWFLWRHRRLMRLVHRWPIHRDPNVACVICAGIWRLMLARDPGIADSIRQGEEDYKAGRWYHYDTATGETQPNPDWPEDGPQPSHR